MSSGRIRRLGIAGGAILVAASLPILLSWIPGTDITAPVRPEPPAVVEGYAPQRTEVPRRSIDDPGPIPSGPLAERLGVATSSFDTELLRRVARSDPDPRIRIAALRRLTRIEGRGARPLLLEVVGDEAETGKVRGRAAALLGETGDTATPLLERIIEGKGSLEVRRGAVEGLARIGSAAAIRTVVAVGCTGDPALRAGAAMAVSRSASMEHVPALVETLESPRVGPAMRVAACTALGNVGSRHGARALIRVIDDPYSADDLLLAAVRSLRRMDDVSVLPAVRRLEQAEQLSPQVLKEVRRTRVRLERD